MAGIIISNKDVFVSYLFTMAKYDFSIYEKRIIYRLLELAQKEIEGLLIKDHLYKVHKPDNRRRIVTMPVASILRGEQDNNYAIAKKAFRSLATKGLEYEDDKIWTFINIIASPKVDKTGGFVTFDVYDEIWQCFLDFTSGFRKYELATAMQFKSTYTMRMYELLSGQTGPLTYIDSFNSNSFTDLCERFKLPKTMRATQAFETKILDVAKAELNAHAPYSFTYKRETVKSRGRNGEKVIGYTFFPVSIQKNRDPELENTRLAAKVGNISGRYGMLEQEVSNMLLHLGFTKEEINANKNKTLFVDAQKQLGVEGMVDALEKIRQSALRNKRVSNLKGYIISGLRTMLKEIDDLTNVEVPAIPNTATSSKGNLNEMLNNLANQFNANK